MAAFASRGIAPISNGHLRLSMQVALGRKNHLLARLQPAAYQRLAERAESVNLNSGQTFYKHGSLIDYVYFPISGIVSARMVMDDGNTIEVATVGNEGVVGHTALFAGQGSPHEMIVRVAGVALRTSYHHLAEEARREKQFEQLLSNYNLFYLRHIAQGLACNGLHSIEKRCCRWLLITLDRMDSDVIPLTHECLGMMLGVRRVSVTEVLRSLQDKGLVKNGRGRITILDRQGLARHSCECYRKSIEEFDRLLGCKNSSRLRSVSRSS